MKGIQMDLISSDKLERLSSVEKIRMILDSVEDGKIIVLERGLTPQEETKLIEATMTKITPGEFAGIEIESYPGAVHQSWFDKLRKKPVDRARLTVIGPADQLKMLKRDRDVISAMVSAR
ncbi:MAG TPA: DUF2073 domain-containing protein [Methanosarcinales archaeon]|nr:MAG: DUF2073 domain-containing protein [Methanosarcinales archaeon]HDN64823.1 DUF2073 domain-containing protein [Methanosarcinales archaeon]